MSIDIRFPNITAKDESGQLLQVKSYLYQLVEQLNWAMKTVETGNSGSIVDANGNPVVFADENDDPVSTFNSVKSLIIKSADIVNAYYEEISTRLEGVYVAESDFGTYKEKTNVEIQKTSTGIAELYTNIQEVLSRIDSLNNTLVEVTAHTNSGFLFYDENGVPVYGFEVGQRTVIDGVEVFNKYARFIADRLSFYDQNGTEVAYISDKKLYITHVEVTGSLLIGGFADIVLVDKSVVTKWIGG